MRMLFLLGSLMMSMALSAQTPPHQRPKLLTPSTSNAAPGVGIQQTSTPSQADPIEEQMGSFIKSYRYPNPTSTSYDTLLRNTRSFSPGEVPKYDAQTIADRLYGLPTVIPMQYNSYVQQYINVYTVRKRELTAQVLGLSRVYFPLFEEELDRRGMPMEIKYLSVVESALNPHARSRVGATGLWQFMLSTGRMYGLTVNSFVDERKDPYKSTEAAMRYLEAAYKEFGDWLLAIASYNCGPGNVRKAIRRSGGKKTFWEIMPYLPRETRGYVPAFIAVNYVFQYASAHNIYPIHVDFSLQQDTIHLQRMDITLSEIAKMTGVEVEVLRYLNPELKLERIPYANQPYVLRVPGRVANYFAKYPRSLRADYGKRREMDSPHVTLVRNARPSSGSSKPPAGTKLYYHRVRSGEVVGEIAERYGVSARAVANWNNLYRYRIKVGQKLRIYTTPAKAAAAAQRRPASSSTSSAPAPAPTGDGTYHRVRRGDTLWDIAKRYNTSVSTIKRLNPRLNERDLKIGQAIRVQ